MFLLTVSFELLISHQCSFGSVIKRPADSTTSTTNGQTDATSGQTSITSRETNGQTNTASVHTSTSSR